MLPKLPQPVVNYLAAVKAQDTEMFALCFTDDAGVHDEGQDYKGLHAIRAWKKETQKKYKDVIEPLDASVSGNTIEHGARLTGDLSGSPVDLDFRVHARIRSDRLTGDWIMNALPDIVIAFQLKSRRTTT